MTKDMRLLSIGLAGLAAGTALALKFDDADGIAGTALMLVLCMSTALCGSAIPGMLKFDSKAIRASGATVFFVLPWLLPYASPAPPAAGTPPAPESPPKDTPPPPPPVAGTRPTIRIQKSTAAKTVAPKPAIGRPRTVFDGLFTSK